LFTDLFLRELIPFVSMKRFVCAARLIHFYQLTKHVGAHARAHIYPPLSWLPCSSLVGVSLCDPAVRKRSLHWREETLIIKLPLAGSEQRTGAAINRQGRIH